MGMAARVRNRFDVLGGMHLRRCVTLGPSGGEQDDLLANGACGTKPPFRPMGSSVAA